MFAFVASWLVFSCLAVSVSLFICLCCHLVQSQRWLLACLHVFSISQHRQMLSIPDCTKQITTFYSQVWHVKLLWCNSSVTRWEILTATSAAPALSCCLEQLILLYQLNWVSWDTSHPSPVPNMWLSVCLLHILLVVLGTEEAFSEDVSLVHCPLMACLMCKCLWTVPCV